MSHELTLSLGAPRRGVPARASFERWLAAAAQVARVRKPLALSVRVVDEDEGRALNRQYRHKDYATNVLSFPADPAPSGGPRFLGDLALCAPVVAREAAEQGKPLKAHYAHLCIHGVLHLLGFDHETEAEAERMEALEVRALAALAIANPYESASDAPLS
ncbi:MAG: rRNA maturation RNase YbeY [Lysobacterales bacterium]